jgi:hypothetical protein
MSNRCPVKRKVYGEERQALGDRNNGIPTTPYTTRPLLFRDAFTIRRAAHLIFTAMTSSK